MSDYQFSEIERGAHPGGGYWIRVTDGDLPMPVDLRIHQNADDRWIVTGVLLGDAEIEDDIYREITSQILRAVKIREIMVSLFKDYDPDAPPSWMKEAVRVSAVVRDNASIRPTPRGPDDQTLRAFAHTYMTEQVRQPGRAMSATAKAHGISRATAHRWAQECRELGYLPGDAAQLREADRVRAQNRRPDPLADNDE